jgi:ribulose-5-phosphate 4-epimerase/fuculose-1-phosphate aldolase
MNVDHSMTAQRPQKYNADEWAIRVDLAAAYRLVHLFGWSDLVSTHISARVPGPDSHFLINPYGLLFDEITASSLVKVDFEGKRVEDTPYSVNPAGFNLHSAVHMAQHHLVCVLHTHTPAGVAVATSKSGLLPLNQQTLLVMGMTGYHDYEGVSLDPTERARVVSALGDKRILILRNHGLITVGTTVPEAFMHMYHMERACRFQVAFLSQGVPDHELSEQVIATTMDQGKRIYAEDGFYQNGKLIWPALMRMLAKQGTPFAC